MITLQLDKPREWRLDVPAFERACDGFSELGMEEFAENPIASLGVLAIKKDADGKSAETFKLNKRTLGVMRVWIWAGLIEPISLKEFSALLVSLRQLPEIMEQILPGINESILGPQEPAPVLPEGPPVASGGQLVGSTSG